MVFQQLNKAQTEAVTAPLAPTLVLAGAGSGKTRVLTNRILYLVNECGVDASQILAITFTNKAANEMKRRLFEFNCNAQYMHISTIHSFCATVLRYEAQLLNLGSNFSIYDENEKLAVLKRIVKDVFDETDGKSADCFAENISAIKNNAPELLDGDIDSKVDDEYFASQLDLLQKETQYCYKEDFVKVIKEYTAKMYDNNALDFDDLLYYVHKLFSNFPLVLEKYQQRYRYILIDEFQDTNKVQYEIFKMLADKYRNIFVVGDDDQSIYSWRGADSYNLMKFKKDFSDANVYTLEQNYRSTKHILDVANAVICKNENRFPKVLWTENEAGVKTQTYSAYSEMEEANYVANQICNLIYLNNSYKYKDFAILMRVNAISRSFEQVFSQNRIPYKVFGGFKFFERKEIKDILCYMSLVNNPNDSVAFVRAINVPLKRGIGDTTLGKLQDIAQSKHIALIDVIADSDNLQCFNKPMQAKLQDFYSLYNDLCELAQINTVSQFVHKMLNILEYRRIYNDAGKDERVLNVDEFEQAVLEYQNLNPHATLGEYLQSVSLSQDTDNADETDYVTIATIHAVKGLEYKTVFVVGLEDGIFPTSRATYNLETMQEERRLMYVACTRAQKRLYLTRANSRFLWGQRKNTFVSRYFSEVQQLLAPPQVRPTERQLADDNYLDRLIKTQPTPTVPSTAKSSSQTNQFVAGKMVEHATFGKGIILRRDGDVIDVAFDGAGKKSLNVKFAPIKLI